MYRNKSSVVIAGLSVVPRANGESSTFLDIRSILIPRVRKFQPTPDRAPFKKRVAVPVYRYRRLRNCDRLAVRRSRYDR